MNLYEISSLGIEFAFIIVGFVWLGNYLDEKFSISPFGLFGFSILGFSYGLYHIIQRSKKMKQ